LHKDGINVFGIDAIAELIENAFSKDGHRYAVCSYENLVIGWEKFIDGKDSFAFNF